MTPQAKVPSGSCPSWLSKSIKKLTRVKQRNVIHPVVQILLRIGQHIMILKDKKLCPASHNSYVLSLYWTPIARNFEKYIKSIYIRKDTTLIMC